MGEARESDRWWSTTEGADALGLSPSAFRSLVARASSQGVDVRAPRAVWPDGRTPRFDRALLRDYLDARPGRGRRRTDPTS